MSNRMTLNTREGSIGHQKEDCTVSSWEDRAIFLTWKRGSPVNSGFSSSLLKYMRELGDGMKLRTLLISWTFLKMTERPSWLWLIQENLQCPLPTSLETLCQTSRCKLLNLSTLPIRFGHGSTGPIRIQINSTSILIKWTGRYTEIGPKKLLTCLTWSPGVRIRCSERRLRTQFTLTNQSLAKD